VYVEECKRSIEICLSKVHAAHLQSAYGAYLTMLGGRRVLESTSAVEVCVGGWRRLHAESIAVDSLSSLCMAVSSIPAVNSVSACCAFTATCTSLGGGAASRLQGEEGERRQRAREAGAKGTAEE
jgi:hypothetical protein